MKSWLFHWRLVFYAVIVLCLAIPSVGAAQGRNVTQSEQLQVALETAWEVLWDQKGSPRPLAKWSKDQPVKVYLSGKADEKLAQSLKTLVNDFSFQTGLRFQVLNQAPASDKEPGIHIEVVDNSKLSDSEPCLSRMSRNAEGYLNRSHVLLREKFAAQCLAHEMMHAMGLIGHPSGRSILSYFSRMGNHIVELDQLLLKHLYGNKMPAGAQPFEALAVYADAFGDYYGDARGEQRREFLKQNINRMQAFALGYGDIPIIVRRSGKALEENAKQARIEIAFYLGQAKWEGLGGALDRPLGYAWLERAEKLGSARAGRYLKQIQSQTKAEDLVALKTLAAATFEKMSQIQKREADRPKRP